MHHGAPESYRRWFEYEKDSHAKVLASLTAVRPDLQASESFQRAMTLMAHLVAARHLWLKRFGVAKEGPSEFFPRGVSLPDLAARVQEMEAAWSAFLNELTEDELARVFEYRSLDGAWFRNTVETSSRSSSATPGTTAARSPCSSAASAPTPP